MEIMATAWAALGYVFKDKNLLVQALTHSSFVYENNLGSAASNERLEFLGDAVLELLTSELLYKLYPNLTEGELSKIRAGMVCEPALASHARILGLGRHLRLGRGETFGGGAEKDSILSDALEAVIGAIYLDGGLTSAKAFVESLYNEEGKDSENGKKGKKGIEKEQISFLTQSPISDPKSTLQEKIQKTSRVPLEYKVIKETGPAHQKKFTSIVAHEGQILGVGTGKSKKEAERVAAFEALKRD